VVSSISSFSELVRSYKLLDRFQEEQTDFFTLLLESYLDDQLDQIVEKTKIEAILRNDEESHILLQSLYEFDVRGSLIAFDSAAQINDSFVSMMNDAVKLISE